MCFEVVWVLESFTDDSVVVNLAIDSKGYALITVGEWLSSGIDTNNGETLVSKNYMSLEIAPPCKLMCVTSAVSNVTPRPIWTTMPALLHHLQSRRLESPCVGYVVATNDSTHDVDCEV
jgi:hypothetical protein